MSTTNVEKREEHPIGSRWLFYPRYERGLIGYEVEIIVGPGGDYDYRAKVVKVIRKNEAKSTHGLREEVLVDHRELIPLIRTIEEVEAFLAT